MKYIFLALLTLACTEVMAQRDTVDYSSSKAIPGIIIHTDTVAVNMLCGPTAQMAGARYIQINGFWHRIDGQAVPKRVRVYLNWKSRNPGP